MNVLNLYMLEGTPLGFYESIKNTISSTFKGLMRVYRVGTADLEYEKTFNRHRSQYNAYEIARMASLSVLKPALIVMDLDFYVPGLNFVFGLVLDGVGLISIKRLSSSFYGIPGNGDLHKRRVNVVALHEVGHLLGLGHCSNRSCCMSFHNSIWEVDKSNPQFCTVCWGKILSVLK